MLAWLNVHPIVQQRELVPTVGPKGAVMMLTAQHHNQVGIGAGWVTQYMMGPTRSRSSSEQDRVGMFNAAGAYWALRNALVEVSVGVRDFEASGTLVRLPYQGNHRIDALDRLLDLVESLDSVGKAPEFSLPLRDWMAGEGRSQPWMIAPAWVRDAFREQAGSVLATYPRYLPDSAMIGPVTVGDLNTFWVELLSWGMHMHAASMLGSVHLPTILPLVRRQDLVGALVTATGLLPSVIESVVALLTLDVARCSDGALTPLVPIHDDIAVMSSLIVPTSPQRNFLAIVQSTPSLVGEAGRLLGLAGERAALDVLGRLGSDILVDGRIKVLRRDGSPAGDFDVVACDPATRTAVIFEIKWGISADGNAEVYRAEQRAIEKRAQVIRLREEVNAGSAIPQWPTGWPDTTGYEFHWYVLTRDVLAMTHIADDDITIRSHQLLSRTLRSGASIADLISVLDSPPIPPTELCQTQWERIRYGDLRVEIESIVA